MDTNNPEWALELEESAEGVELFHPPGSELQLEKAADQAEASGWIPNAEDGETRPSDHLDLARVRRGELRRAMGDVETAIAGPASAGGWLRQVEVATRELTTALAKHVKDVESTRGLLAEIVGEAPRLKSQVETMRREHEELTETTRGLLDLLNLEEGQDASDLRQAILSLLGELALHRQHGSDLVYDAYNIDIAAAD